MTRKCQECQVALPPKKPGRGRPAVRCVDCNSTGEYARVRAYRARNPDKVAIWKARQQARQYASGASRPMADVKVEEREHTLARAREIAALLAKGLSCRQAAIKLRTTKNAVIGVMDRARRHYGFGESGGAA